MVVLNIDRNYADSSTMSTLGQKTSEVTKSKKSFKEFYDIYGNAIEMEDKERTSELGLSDTDMPNGYAIINEDKEEVIFELIDEVIYTFTDVELYFIKESEGNRLYTTTKKDEFIKHLGKLNDYPLAEQKIP